MPDRAPHWLERVAAACLRADPDDNRLGDLSEGYVRAHERARSHLGAAPWALAASHLAADFHYLAATANVVLFARAIEPVLRAVENATMPVVAMGVLERSMATLLAVIDLGERTMTMLRATIGKVVLPGLLLAGCTLLVSSALDVWSMWRQTETLMTRLQLAKAESAAIGIEQTLAAVQGQIALTTIQPAGSSALEQRRVDFLRLQRHVPAITEVAWLDATGREELRTSRVAMNVVGSGADFSRDTRFTQAQAQGKYFGPVYFDKRSEPHISLAVAHANRTGVTVAEVNFKMLWDAIRAIDVGETGYAYLIDGRGRLIAHRNTELMRRQPDLSALPQVAAALAGRAPAEPVDGTPIDAGLSGASVISVYSAVPTPGWRVIVDLPVTEARGPFWSALLRAGSMLGLGLVALLLASLVALRRIRPAHPA